MLPKIIGHREAAEQNFEKYTAALQEQLADYEFYNLLKTITGDKHVELYRETYAEKTIKEMLDKQNIPEVFNELFKPPVVKRKGYWQLRQIEDIVSIIDQLAARYKAAGQIDKLRNAAEIYNVLKNKSVNDRLQKTKLNIASLEKILINLLLHFVQQHQPLDCPALGRHLQIKDEPGKPALVFLYSYIRFLKNSYPLADTPDGGIIPLESIYYQQVYRQADLLESFPDLKLETSVRLGADVVPVLELFFEPLSAGEYLPRLNISEEAKAAANKHFNDLANQRPHDAFRETLLDFKKDFLQEARQLRQAERFSNLRPAEVKQFKENFNKFLQKLYPILVADLQKGLEYTALRDFIEQTNFTAKGEQNNIRRKIAEMSAYYFNGASPLPAPDDLYQWLELASNPLPQGISNFLAIEYKTNPELAKDQELSGRQLLALYFAYRYPEDFAQYRAEFLP